MIISKLQQFIIFNCDQTNTSIADLLSGVSDKISSIQKPNSTGGSFLSWSPGVPSQLSQFQPNTVYLVNSKVGQLGYEIIGATEATGYCNNIITSNYTLNVDNYHIILDKFFDKNYDIYYFDSNVNEIVVPQNCDYAISFGSSNKTNRNFSIFENENDYPNLFFQYSVSNLAPQVDEEVTFNIRVINFSNSVFNNILLNFKQNFNLNFQGSLEYLSLNNLDLKQCSVDSNKLFPYSWTCCPDYSARQLSSQCNDSISVKFDLQAYDYYDIDMIFKVINPTSMPITLGEPNFEARSVLAGQIFLPLATLRNNPIGGWGAVSNGGVIIGKVGNNGKNIEDLKKVWQAIDAYEAAEESCRAEGGVAKIIIEIVADQGPQWLNPTRSVYTLEELETGNFIFISKLGRTDLEKRKLAEEKIKIWLKKWGIDDNGSPVPNPEIFIRVECIKFGVPNTTIYPPTIPPNNPPPGSGEVIGSNNCQEEPNFTPRGLQPGCDPKVICKGEMEYGGVKNPLDLCSASTVGIRDQKCREALCEICNNYNRPDWKNFCCGLNEVPSNWNEVCGITTTTTTTTTLNPTTTTTTSTTSSPNSTCECWRLDESDSGFVLPIDCREKCCCTSPDSPRYKNHAYCSGYACPTTTTTTTTTTSTTTTTTTTTTTATPTTTTTTTTTTTPRPECRTDSDCVYDGQSGGYLGPTSCMTCQNGNCVSQLQDGETCCDGKRCTGQCCTGCTDGLGPTYQHCCTTDINGLPAQCVETTGDGGIKGTCCETCPAEGCGGSSGNPTGIWHLN